MKFRLTFIEGWQAIKSADLVIDAPTVDLAEVWGNEWGLLLGLTLDSIYELS